MLCCPNLILGQERKQEDFEHALFRNLLDILLSSVRILHVSVQGNAQWEMIDRGGHPEDKQQELGSIRG
jgi:hypothetical protein